jgi:hypothetical protein
MSLAKIYEDLVDREYKGIEKEVKYIMLELKFILKSIEEDDL